MSSSDHSSPAKLIYMANQSGKLFASQNPEKTPAAIADHLTKFWHPRMRSKIVAHLDDGGDGLDSPVRDAVESLRPKQ